MDAEFDPWPKDFDRDSSLGRSLDDGKAGFDGISAPIEQLAGVDIGIIRSNARSRTVVAARRAFVGDAVRAGHALISIAEWLNVSRSTVGRYARQNTAQREA
jgi:hypothetical protein